MRSIPLWLCLLLVFMTPWENVTRIDGLGTFTRLVGLALVLTWVLAVVAQGRVRKPHLFHFAFFLFFLLNLISVLWTSDLAVTRTRVMTYAQLGILSVVLWDVILTPGMLRRALQAYVLGAYISIASVVINYSSGDALGLYKGRYTGTDFNANDLALILCLGVPIAWHLAISGSAGARSRFPKIVNYTYVPAAGFGIVLTASRTALFALAPAVAYMIASLHGLKPSVRVLALLAAAGIVLALQSYVPESSIQRFATIGASFAQRDLGGRVLIWEAVGATVVAHPLLGVGSGGLRAVIGGVSHNSFLSILAELGLLGLTMFLLLMGIVIREAIRQPRRHSALWLTVLLIWSIGVSTLTWEYYKPTWLVFSFIVVSSAMFTEAATQEKGKNLLESASRNQAWEATQLN